MRLAISRASKMHGVVGSVGALLVVTLLSLISSSIAAHASRRYCLNFRGHEDCSFSTLQQCHATRHGQGGMCYRKPGT